MSGKMILLLIGVGLMVVFVLQNMTVVQVEFLFWRLEASRVLIYLSLFLIGAGVGWLGRSMRGRH